MEKLKDIDFYDNDYDLSIAFHTKGESSHMSLSKKDKEALVHKHEIINALALGVIGIGNSADLRYEDVITDILKRCQEIEIEQGSRS